MISAEKNIPAKTNIILDNIHHINAFQKESSASASFLILLIAYLIAEPTPIISPIENIILYNGITRFNAVSPSAPFAIDIKYESART